MADIGITPILLQLAGRRNGTTTTHADQMRLTTEAEIAFWWKHYAGAVRNVLAPAASIEAEPVADDGCCEKCGKHMSTPADMEPTRFCNNCAQIIAEAHPAAPAGVLAELRAMGLSVAVHNDYRLNGVPHTFYLMTRADGMSFKGEGLTDADALEQIRALATPPAEPAQADGGGQAELREALRDMLAGWKYIRSTHGDLYGVGWDRAQNKAEAALAAGAGV